MQDTSLAETIEYVEFVAARDADRLAFSLEKFAQEKIAEPQLHSLLRRLATACRDYSHATQILASAPPKIREAIARSIP